MVNNKKIKKVMVMILLVMLMCFNSNSVVFSMNAESTNNDVDDITEPQQAIDTEIMIKENERMIKQNDKEVEEYLKSLKESNDFSIMSTIPTVNVGQNRTFYYANIGNSGQNSWGVGIANGDYSITNRRARSSASAVGIGSGQSWGLVGLRFNVSGSSNRTAYIRMAGSYRGSLLGSFTGYSNAQINLHVYDLSASSELDSRSILNITSSDGIARNPNNSYNRSSLVSLQPGRQYLAYLRIDGAVQEYGAGISNLNFRDSIRFTDYSSIRIDWQ
ncbi:hypothetical protein [Candidatus Contubernalis alkaliaceticus]|uniref:hypothetical protein n=1 Tax=Candidatus Contubernalis alkaliaceticus TaxID=338645 RepID=UPI001F4BFA0B|nr:hypothetical protein [Candidatus Contubernalis alkalaceticus]UNC92813.1 hypothetical protein HUE98_12325 [Candidatus Contubernalis alkalaceticus]